MAEALLTRKPTRDSETQALKIPPHSIEAEQAVLGGLLIDNEAWDKVCERVQSEDFYRHEHRLVYEVMQDLARRDQPFDVVTLSEALKNKKPRI